VGAGCQENQRLQVKGPAKILNIVQRQGMVRRSVIVDKDVDPTK